MRSSLETASQSLSSCDSVFALFNSGRNPRTPSISSSQKPIQHHAHRRLPQRRLEVSRPPLPRPRLQLTPSPTTDHQTSKPSPYTAVKNPIPPMVPEPSPSTRQLHTTSPTPKIARPNSLGPRKVMSTRAWAIRRTRSLKRGCGCWKAVLGPYVQRLDMLRR